MKNSTTFSVYEEKLHAELRRFFEDDIKGDDFEGNVKMTVSKDEKVSNSITSA